MLSIKYLSIDELKPYENNPRINDCAVDSVANSIKEFGFKVPIVITKDNVIVAGHTRLLAAKKLGLDEVPCIIADDLSDQQIKAFRLADNKVSELAEWDFSKLEMELAEIELDMSLFSFEELEIETEDNVSEDNFDIDEALEEISTPTTQKGQLWKLGNHYLMCGDSTNKNDVEKLMQGNKADMVFTDPPYNVAFNGRSGKFDVIKNDDLTDNEFNNFISLICDTIRFINPKNYYIWCNWKFYSNLQTKLEFNSCIVWAKNVFGLGKGYRHQHEFCLFKGKIDEDITNESDLWEIAKDTNYVHPTQKPIALICRALKNHKTTNTVLDLFGGSGSTLIGCEKMNRICYTMELDEKYCDVIIQRWETLTGKKATLIF